VLVQFFKHFKINLVSGWKGSTLDFFEDTSHPLVKLFKCLWADNTDFISQQYTGTDSVNSYFSHTGKDTLMGPIDQGLKSMWRTLIDVGSYDTQKNKSIEKLLGSESSNQNEYVRAPSEQTSRTLL
jgi:hypothetical protein